MSTSQHLTTLTSLADTYYKLREANDLDMKEKFAIASEVIQGCKEENLYFYRRLGDAKVISEVSTPYAARQDDKWINLASNDYLNLTTHPRIVQVVQEASLTFGVGAGSVPMLSGTFSVHRDLEEALAKMTNTEAAITFNSGFMANVGLLATILGPTDVAILDSYVHASIIDGCHGTKKVFFQHNQPDSLHRALIKVKDIRNKVVVIDGVYSMDGDIANLPAILEVAKSHGALLVIDESHALGAIGAQGRGTFDYFNLKSQADIITGSLGKALGGIGGFVAGSSQLVNFLELYSRSFIFSTAIPPNSAAGILAAISLIEEHSHLLQRLHSNVHFFRRNLQELGFRLGHSETAIQPLFISDMDLLMKFCLHLHQQGILINPIVFPVVPKKKSRIRLSLTAGLSQDQMELTLECFSRYGHKLKLI